MLSAPVAQLWHLIRQHQDDAATIDFYIDECHRVPHRILNELLAESRKYGVRLRLATQSPCQLDPTARDAVLTNTGATATFRVGPSDAARLDPVFPSVPAGTLPLLGRHWLAVSDGEEDLVGKAAPPIVDPMDRSALEAAHRHQHPANHHPRLPFPTL